MKRWVLVISILLSGAIACTSSPESGPEAQPSNEATNDDRGTGKGKDGAVPEASAVPPSQLGDAPPKGSNELTSAKAEVADPANDAQRSGDSPFFSEIVGASVEAFKETLYLTVTLADDVPTVMPDETTHLIVSWNLAGTKKYPTAGFLAQASTEGWLLSAGQNSDTTEFPGELAIEGNEIIITVPWDYVGKPRKFDWSTAVSWVSNTDGAASSSGDNVPEGKFP